MERDFLGDAGGFQPVLQWRLCHLVRKADEDGACSSLADQFQSLVTYGIVYQFLCFLHTKGNIHTSIAVWLYVLPCELLDVALSQTCQTSKEKSGFQNRILAWGVRQPDKLILGQVLFLCGDGVYALQEAVGVLHNLVFPVGSMKYGTEG